MRISKRFLMIASMCYLYLPIEIFVCTWTKWYIALPATLFFGWAFLRFLARSVEGEALELHPAVFIFILIFLLVVAYFAGWGNFVIQTGDWKKHNTILSDLINYSWPVYYSNSGEHSMLTYYLAMYMVPALLGKVFGHSFAVAQLANGIWSYLGLLLVALNLLRVLHCRKVKSQLLTIFMLIFYAGPIWIGQKLILLIYPGFPNVFSPNSQWMVSSYQIQLQYTNDFSLLQWVYPQAIGPWLIMLLFLEHRKQIEDYCVILLPGLFFATLPFLGLVPFAVVEAFVLLYDSRNFMEWLKRIFTIENVLTMVCYLLIFGGYFIGNVTGDKPEFIGFSRVDYSGYEAVYPIFILFTFGLYGLCLLKSNHRNHLFWTATVLLVLIPFVRMGLYNDWCMRTSIPALFIYMLLMLEFLMKQWGLNEEQEGKMLCSPSMTQKPATVCMTILLLVAIIYPLSDMRDVIKNDEVNKDRVGEVMTYGTLETYANRNLDLSVYSGIYQDVLYNYYTYDIEEQFFYKYIARTKHAF